MPTRRVRTRPVDFHALVKAATKVTVQVVWLKIPAPKTTAVAATVSNARTMRAAAPPALILTNAKAARLNALKMPRAQTTLGPMCAYVTKAMLEPE